MYFCNFIKKVVAQRKEWCRLRSRKRHNKITTLRFLLFSHLEFSTLENKNLKRFSFRSVVLTQSGMEIIKSLPAKSANLEHIEKVKGFFFKNGFLEVA